MTTPTDDGGAVKPRFKAFVTSKRKFTIGEWCDGPGLYVPVFRVTPENVDTDNEQAQKDIQAMAEGLCLSARKEQEPK